jgi:tRNA(Ser,Leu) C12 N-acetylase TAN1
MHDWNVVATVHEGGYNQGKRFLEQFGPVHRTDFYNILVMRVGDHQLFLEALRERTERNTEGFTSLARVIPVVETFTFQTPAEFETKSRHAVCAWLPVLANKGFHLRMHRRGLKGKLSSMDEERFLDTYILEALALAGTPGHINFDSPDAIIALESIGPRAGLSLWSSEELERYPCLHLD